MLSLLEHAALVAALAALGAAGLRLATAAGARGLVRPVAATVAAGAAVVVEALALGLLGLGGSAPALLLAAVGTWVLARLRLPASGVRAEAAGWWRDAGGRARAGAGVAVVLPVGWAAWQLRYPHLGADALTYHLPLAVEYVEAGRAGVLEPVLLGTPVENYPVTNEVLVSWAMGLSGSWVVASTLTPAFTVLLVAAGWLGLRELRVPARTAALAVAALTTLPVVLTQLGGPNTDVPTLAWLVSAGALAAASLGNPRLLAFALVAAALSFGTKTTGSVALAVAVGGAAWASRGALRGLVRPLGVAAGVALVVGGIWAIRNTVLHGSPLWPLVATSFGDPVPRELAQYEASFLSHPREVLDGRVGEYLRLLAGGVLLLAGGLLAPLLGRSRASVAAGALAAVTALTWTLAPYTGITENTLLAVGAVRYLLPCLAVCTVALALAARDGGPAVRLGIDVLLGLAVLGSVARVLDVGFPLVPGVATLLGLAVVGGVAGVVAGRVRLPALPAPAVGLAVALLAVLGLSLGAREYVARHTETRAGDRGLLGASLTQPVFRDASVRVAMGPSINALMAGDRLENELTHLDGSEPCAEVREQRRAGWVVLQRLPPTPEYRRLSACLGAKPTYEDPLYEVHAGG